MVSLLWYSYSSFKKDIIASWKLPLPSSYKEVEGISKEQSCYVSAMGVYKTKTEDRRPKTEDRRPKNALLDPNWREIKGVFVL